MKRKTDKPAAPDPDDPQNRDLVDEYTPLVRMIAYKIAKDLPQNVDVKDLMQDGIIGLLDAVLRFNKKMSAQQFRAFASVRIRGAIYDGLRANDSGARRVRQAMRLAERATHALEQQLCRAPNECEVAAALGLSLSRYQKTLQNADGYHLISLEDLDGEVESGNYLEFCAQSNADPLAALERKEFQETLAIALNKLPPLEICVVANYYEERCTMREIGLLLELTEGRISQIHTQAIVRLRASVFGNSESPALLRPRRRPRE